MCFSYDGSELTDYDVKVEQIEIDLKTEKEQNIFLNNKRVQGETDMELMAELIQDIDIENAALEDYDIEMIETLVPNFKMGANELIKEDIAELKATDEKKEHEKKEHVKNVKSQIKNLIKEQQLPTHFTVTFKTYDQKAEFLESIGINGDDIFITSDKFINRINGQ
jgi:hypothetical protein